MTTVLFAGGGTGGHLMPALAIGNLVRAERPDWRVVFAGAHRGIEATVLPERGLPHYLLPLQPIYRRQWWKNVAWPVWMIPLLREIDAMLVREHPAVVIGTGGYASGPVVWRAARRGIPTAILELDAKPGIATRWLSGSVRAIWLASADAMAGLREGVRGRAVVTGAPIVPPEPARRLAARAHWQLTDDRPVVVVTGGSQGAVAINRAVAGWLQGGGAGERGQGGAECQVIWATGRTTFAEFAVFHRPPAVHVVPFIDPMADAWAVADLAVTRAGMNTLAELCAWGIASVVVPLATAAGDHQRHNARALEQGGAAVTLAPERLTAATLGAAVSCLLNDPSHRRRMADAARARGRPQAASEIASRVIALAA